MNKNHQVFLESISESINKWFEQFKEMEIPLQPYRIKVRDVKESESDSQGYTYWTTRHIDIYKVNTGLNTGMLLLISAKRIIEGKDEYQGYYGGTGETNLKEEYWTIVRESDYFNQEMDTIKTLSTTVLQRPDTPN